MKMVQPKQRETLRGIGVKGLTGGDVHAFHIFINVYLLYVR